MSMQDHGCVKFAFLLFYAGIVGIILYKILMGYAEKNECTVEKNPIFADLLRCMIAMATGVDIALAAWLIAEVTK